MKKRNDLNSVLIEGTISQIKDDSFVIQNFESVKDKEGKYSNTFENRFEILTPHGKKYPIKIEMKTRVVGKLRYQNGDSNTLIKVDHIEFPKG